ncbi:MAG TPA: DUF2085 domain-containing protein [Herpetosiphonaceae bacterium]
MMTGRATPEPFADRFGRVLVTRWPLLISGLLAIYAGLPWLSPLLRSWGFERIGQTIFAMYRTLCHQLPERSFFIGQYQVCYCHRCTALYTSLLVMSVIFSIGRWQHAISNRLLLLLTLPMAIDGTWHLLNDLLPGLGLRADVSAVDSLNFWLRIVTGALFAIGVVLWAYPRLQRGIAQD